LLSSGSMRCWGSNGDRQLGDLTATDRLTPQSVFGLSGVVGIAAGTWHSCALLVDGTAKCWGYNGWGATGVGNISDSHPDPTSSRVSGLSNASAITAGHVHSCALQAAGTVRCWGGNSRGELGDDTTTDRGYSEAVTALGNAVAVTGGFTYTCALLADGTARCWGFNDHGQLGSGSIGGQVNLPVTVRNLSNAVAIAAGDDHACALLASGAATCWGRNDFGQLGNSGPQSGSPTTVPGTGGFTARDVAAGRDHTCAVRANGLVVCWGRNDSGQVGAGTTAGIALSPVAVPNLSNVTAIAAGDAHSCALLANGRVRCWGLNTSGQLGDNSTTSSSTPVDVFNLSNVVAIAAGGALASSHTCALQSDGRVQCWGANGSGQLGDNTLTNRRRPVEVVASFSLPLRLAVGIAVGAFHSCAVTVDGDAFCWGLNSSGQIGDGTQNNRQVAVPVAGVEGIAVAVTAGDFHTCLLAAVGVPFCWGDNTFGQLGDATRQTRLTATLVGLDSTVAIAGGFDHSCALVAFGAARCWGENGLGQLGDSTTSDHWFPAPVQSVRSYCLLGGGCSTITTPLTNTVSIVTGRRHSCALLTTGGVSCWGDNSFGQLGFGSTAAFSTGPGAVPSFTLNIDPAVSFESNGRVATVTVVATCEVGERLSIDVSITQGPISGRGHGSGACTGALERYPVTVPALGPGPFVAGAAQVTAQATIRDRGLIADMQEWTRQVTLVSAP
jgi:alpha-tubulin suppressor-like RCC1 family protein